MKIALSFYWGEKAGLMFFGKVDGIKCSEWKAWRASESIIVAESWVRPSHANIYLKTAHETHLHLSLFLWFYANAGEKKRVANMKVLTGKWNRIRKRPCRSDQNPHSPFCDNLQRAIFVALLLIFFLLFQCCRRRNPSAIMNYPTWFFLLCYADFMIHSQVLVDNYINCVSLLILIN